MAARPSAATTCPPAHGVTAAWMDERTSLRVEAESSHAGRSCAIEFVRRMTGRRKILPPSLCLTLPLTAAAVDTSRQMHASHLSPAARPVPMPSIHDHDASSDSHGSSSLTLCAALASAPSLCVTPCSSATFLHPPTPHRPSTVAPIAMSVDLSSGEEFALASSGRRAQIIAERHAADSEPAMTATLRQLQLQIIEAREGSADAQTLKSLVDAENQVASKLRESQFRHTDNAESQSTGRHTWAALQLRRPCKRPRPRSCVCV